jgi:uncharacterized membrane protein YfhO
MKNEETDMEEIVISEGDKTPLVTLDRVFYDENTQEEEKPTKSENKIEEIQDVRTIYINDNIKNKPFKYSDNSISTTK